MPTVAGSFTYNVGASPIRDAIPPPAPPLLSLLADPTPSELTSLAPTPEPDAETGASLALAPPLPPPALLDESQSHFLYQLQPALPGDWPVAELFQYRCRERTVNSS